MNSIKIKCKKCSHYKKFSVSGYRTAFRDCELSDKWDAYKKKNHNGKCKDYKYSFYADLRSSKVGPLIHGVISGIFWGAFLYLIRYH